MLAHKDGDHVRLISRQGKDFTRRFPELVAAIKADAVNTYQQGQGFVGIEKLPSEIEQQLRGASYVRHAQEIRNALKRKDHGAILSELILVLERLERARG
jgi:hypothetical protein